MLEYNTALFNQLLAYMPCALYWQDKAGRYAGCNQRFAQYLCLPISHIIGKTSAQLPVRLQDLDTQVMQTQTVIEQTETLHVNNESMKLHVRRIPLIQAGNAFGVLGLVQDVTELTALKERANVNDMLNLAFIRNLEHDLNTPLAGILSLSQMLSAEESDPEKQTLLNDITTCAQALLTHCQAVLETCNLVNVERPVLSKPFSLQDVLVSVLNQTQVAAKAKNLALNTSLDPTLPTTLIGDGPRIETILLNLVKNAIKFTQTGSIHVNLSSLSRPTSPRHVLLSLSVHDTGIGIAEDKQGWIYQRFTKVGSSNQGQMLGLGLGLSVVKQFVDALDGDIFLKSKPNDGTLFTVHIPLKVPL